MSSFVRDQSTFLLVTDKIKYRYAFNRCFKVVKWKWDFHVENSIDKRTHKLNVKWSNSLTTFYFTSARCCIKIFIFLSLVFLCFFHCQFRSRKWSASSSTTCAQTDKKTLCWNLICQSDRVIVFKIIISVECRSSALHKRMLVSC